ncbi:hypothetical protein MP11Mi_00920 [Gordonia sp. MP11Mi]|uniref:Uncharacterized protein n=1 Tax=Gordonia sp. MP11Mi TaxID=3022769 RepID=A0AA97CRC1_9ACTN
MFRFSSIVRDTDRFPRCRGRPDRFATRMCGTVHFVVTAVGDVTVEQKRHHLDESTSTVPGASDIDHASTQRSHWCNSSGRMSSNVDQRLRSAAPPPDLSPAMGLGNRTQSASGRRCLPTQVQGSRPRRKTAVPDRMATNPCPGSTPLPLAGHLTRVMRHVSLGHARSTAERTAHGAEGNRHSCATARRWTSVVNSAASESTFSRRIGAGPKFITTTATGLRNYYAM